MFLQLFKGTLKSKLKSDTKRFEYLPAPSQSIEDGLFIYCLFHMAWGNLSFLTRDQTWVGSESVAS